MSATPRTDAEWIAATAKHEAMVVKEANARIRIAQLEGDLAEVTQVVEGLTKVVSEAGDMFRSYKAALAKAREAIGELNESGGYIYNEHEAECCTCQCKALTVELIIHDEGCRQPLVDSFNAASEGLEAGQ